MPHHYDYFWVGDGDNAQTVGYSTTERNGYYGVRFLLPDGKRVERMTGIAINPRAKSIPVEFQVEAAKIISKAYAPTMPDPKRVKWEDAVQSFPGDLTEQTRQRYTSAVGTLRETLKLHKQEPASPNAITPELANQFATFYLAGTYTRSNKEGATQYKRKPKSLEMILRQLSASWSIWKLLGYVKENPWLSVRKPKVDVELKPVPTEEQTTHFFNYLKERYPEWERLHCLLELKAFASCRTADVCSLRSDQLQNGRVFFEAAQLKQREARTVLVPETLFTRLKAVAGKTYLWEEFPADMLKFRKSKNRKTDGFSPEGVQVVVENIFREYADSHPDRPRLTPHSFRRRGITLTVAGLGSVDLAAQAIGITPECARNYYLDAKRAFNTDDVFRKLSGVLLPKTTTENESETKA